MRDIDIRPPAFARCDAFADWTDEAPGPDVFPPRAQLGRYLAARYAHLRQHGGLSLRHDRTPIDGLSRSAAGWLLHAGSNRHGPYAEVLLTLGQPEVAPDDQLAEWQAHAGRTDACLQQAYPAWRLQRDAADWAGQTVAVRGLAMSAFDVICVLTLGQGGRFESGRYIASGGSPSASHRSRSMAVRRTPSPRPRRWTRCSRPPRKRRRCCCAPSPQPPRRLRRRHGRGCPRRSFRR